MGPEIVRVSKFYKESKDGKFVSYLSPDARTLYDTFRKGAKESTNTQWLWYCAELTINTIKKAVNCPICPTYDGSSRSRPMMDARTSEKFKNPADLCGVNHKEDIKTDFFGLALLNRTS
ncbi:hypothetical protein J6590_105265, partial [Homalodisca vitripennis]